MIERIYIQNFRCLESFTLDLAGRPSALLIGKNGSGKSTIRSSLSVLQGICRGLVRVSDHIAVGDFAQHRTDRPMRFEVDINLSGRAFRYSTSIILRGSSEPRIFDETLAVNGQTVFARKDGLIQVDGAGVFNLDWHFFALPIISQRAGEKSIEDIKAFFASMLLIAPVPARMTGLSERASNELAHDASNFASCLRALLSDKPAAYAAFDEYLKSSIPDFATIENRKSEGAGTQLMVRFERTSPRESLTVEFSSLSDGEKCFMLSAYIVAANKVGPPVFCMWDEPDNHLSLADVGQFIMGLRRLPNDGGQIIATTHHPETLRKFSDETTIVLTRKSHLDPALPRLLSDFSYNGDLINALIRDEIIGGV